MASGTPTATSQSRGRRSGRGRVCRTAPTKTNRTAVMKNVPTWVWTRCPQYGQVLRRAVTISIQAGKTSEVMQWGHRGGGGAWSVPEESSWLCEAFSGWAVGYTVSSKGRGMTCSFPVRADSLGPGIVLSCTGPKSRTRRPPQRPITAPNRPTTVRITHDCGERTDTGRVAIFGNLSLGGQTEQALPPFLWTVRPPLGSPKGQS